MRTIDDRAGKYLIFQLGEEEFGIRVREVREIIGLQEITAVPHTPAYVRGVINLRGKVIPVLDLRLRVGLPPADYTPRTCIIVAEGQTQPPSSPMLTGFIVDGVSEVLSLGAGDIEDTPDFGHGAPPPYLLGIAKGKGKVKILLEISQLLTGQEPGGLEAGI